jgi:hypothetical protein
MASRPLTTPNHWEFGMAKLIYSRNDIEVLCDRLETRASSIMLADMPLLCADMRSAARLLRFMLGKGVPVSVAEIENNG